MSEEDLQPMDRDEALDADTPIAVQPFIEGEGTAGARTWIRKAMVTGVEEVTASEWNTYDQKATRPSMLVHAVGGKTWRIVGDAEAFVRGLGQAEL